MLHIAVCDDDIKMLGEVKQILTDYCKAKKLAFKISAYCDGTDLLASEESFSVIFLDIEMQQSNGIEVAKTDGYECSDSPYNKLYRLLAQSV